MITFKQFFTESNDEVTKITSPDGSYKVRYGDGVVERYRLNEYSDQPVTCVYIDKYGFAHSPDNNTPAITTHDKSNDTIIKEWYTHGTKHRDGDEPAEISRFIKTGQLNRLFYIKNGKKHRLTGPAVISFYNGAIDSQDYYIHGVHYTKEEFDEYTKGLESKEDKELLGDLGQTFD